MTIPASKFYCKQKNYMNRAFNYTHQTVAGPFYGCQGCPYPAHGFLCYSKDGTCLRTVLKAMKSHPKQEK